MRTCWHIVAATALIGAWSWALGQGVTQSGTNVTFTINSPVMKVQAASLPVETVTGLAGPGITYCHLGGDFSGSARVGIGDAIGDNNRFGPEGLKARLLANVYKKSLKELSTLVGSVQDAAKQEEKMQRLFLISPQFATAYKEGSNSFFFGNADAGIRLLMGESVVLSFKSDAPLHDTNLRCYSPQQVDQIIAEGLRIVKAISLAMEAAPAKPPAKQ